MNNSNFSIKITKKTLIKKGMFNYKFFLINGRIYNLLKTHYKRFRCIISFDENDLYDYFEKERITLNEKQEFMQELICVNTFLINAYDDTDEFYASCRESLINFNNR